MTFNNLKLTINKLLIFGYLLTILSLFLYSFTQVDLSLTLTEASWWQSIQKFFQHIGYFDRPLSTFLYIFIISLLFFFYLGFINLSKRGDVGKKTLWKLIIFTALILTFSYSAFSYDIFNYIFDARIVTEYGKNPYMHKALDFPGDPMLSFMHWTHRTYPYGPSWLISTVPFSFLGTDFFLFTFFLFKGIASLSFLGCCYFISMILRKISPKNELLGLSLFAFNPLIMIEGLVSAHNDITMMAFALMSLFLLLSNKFFLSLLSLFFSVGIKFATIFMAPLYIYFFLKRKSKNFKIENFLNLIYLSMFIPLIFVTIRTNFQPWYLFYVIPFACLIPNKFYARKPVIALSLFALLQYVPFLYKGDWNEPIPQILFSLTILGFAAAFFSTLPELLKKKW
jgi:hypothetical protein